MSERFDEILGRLQAATPEPRDLDLITLGNYDFIKNARSDMAWLIAEMSRWVIRCHSATMFTKQQLDAGTPESKRFCGQYQEAAARWEALVAQLKEANALLEIIDERVDYTGAREAVKNLIKLYFKR